MKHFRFLACLSVLCFAGAAFAAEGDGKAPPLNWDAAPVDIVLQAYAESINKIVLKDPGLPSANITLKARDGQQLTLDEYLEAIEVVLEMNGVHLEPYGEKFIRAIPRSKARKEGIPLILDPDTELRESGKVVSMMIPFKNIAVTEAQKLFEGLKSDTGILLVFERTNSILVTDTEQNINRMIEIAKTVDVASPVLENVFVRQIKYASVTDVKTILENIVKESQAAQEKENGKGATTAANQNASRFQGPPDRRTLGNRRNEQQQQQPQTPTNESLVMSVSDADRGMIRGKVIMMSDERSNKLIVITQQANMDFFDKIIEQMDVETTPDVKVEVVRLKYADAEEVSDMINDLIGNAASSKSNTKNNTNQNAQRGTSANVTSGTSRGAANAANRTSESKAGELNKDNVVVLADKRINGLVIMARTQDMPVLHQIIEAMDVKLNQVLIETVIIEVGLTDEIKTGIDWVSQLNERNAISGGGGSTSTYAPLEAVAASGVDGTTGIPISSGLNYAGLNKKLNLGMVVEASKSDNRTKYIASPIIMTVDNKEAVIEATQMRYMLTGFTSSGTSYSTIAVPNYEQKQIGITIKTTPKINPNGTVMLTVEEEYSQLGEGQTIQTNGGLGSGTGNNTATALMDVNVDTTVTRKMSADISLEDGQSVVIGGLTETKKAVKETGIPVLKDIPWIGRYLFGSTQDTEERKELLVFMTPYVLKDAEDAKAEAARRKGALSDARPWDDNGWSKSVLADPVSAKEKLRRQTDEWQKEDEERATALALEQAKLDRVVELEKKALEENKMTREEAEERIERLNRIEQEKAELRAEADLEARANNGLLQELSAEVDGQNEEAEPVEAPAAE